MNTHRISILSFFQFFILPFLSAQTVPLHWIGQAPAQDKPATLGIPFAKGELTQKQSVVLKADGTILPTDCRPLAYWADGSVKWSAVSAVIPAGKEMKAEIIKQKPTASSSPMLSTTSQQIIVNTGVLQAYFPTQGSTMLDSLVMNGVKVAGAAQLVLTTQSAATADGQAALHYTDHHLRYKAEVENTGNVRTVIKVTAPSPLGGKATETVRLYFYQGSPEVRIVNSFVYDGQQERDFIHALGLRFEVPMREQLYNRHVAFATQQGGVWAESVQPLSGRRILNNDPSLEVKQVAGQRIAEPSTFDEKGQDLLRNWASWNSFRLTQPNDQGFSIQKRAHHNNPWIGTYSGTRAPGYAFVGDVTGGLGIGLKEFWQSYPTSLQIDSAATDVALLTCYLWSPDAPAMDLRHYDNVAHDLNASYEDVQDGMSTPYGIARTSTLTLLPESRYPGKAAVAQRALQMQDDAPLLPTAQYLHDKQAFGVWSMPDRSTEARANVENLLTQFLDFYIVQQQQHHWYGFWNYGDFMHQYDPARHEWKYDVGGFAWDNTELGTPSWLWYSFLRTERYDIWKAAVSMTRHCSEVDVYHIGEMQGLGSRHNVSHWGCGAKEARISQAAWNRFMYYLTADERLGDLMSEVRDADQKLYDIDPMRLALPREKYPCTAPARLRVGPDWLAYAGNWMTEYERTGNIEYKKKIEAGMKSICKLPNKMFTGPGVLGFDPKTGILSWEGDPKMEHTNHLCAIMGGFELNHEMMTLLPNKEWELCWLEYCRDYQPKTSNGFRISRLKAYAAWKLQDKQMAADAWKDMWTYSNKMQHYEFRASQIATPEVPENITESPQTSTNDAALWSLEAIFMQEVIPE